MHSFGVVQAQRTSSNLLEPQQHSDSTVWRGLSNEFGGFDCTEPSLSTVLQGGKGGACCPMSSGWFDCTEPYDVTGETRCAGCLVRRFGSSATCYCTGITISGPSVPGYCTALTSCGSSVPGYCTALVVALLVTSYRRAITSYGSAVTSRATTS